MTLFYQTPPTGTSGLKASPGCPSDVKPPCGTGEEGAVAYNSAMPDLWRLFVDTGGTFTDCLALSPEGGVWKRAKVLSSGELRLTHSAYFERGPRFFAGIDGGRDASGGGWSFSPGLEAPLLAAHLVTDTPLAQTLPKLSLRLATTRGTNALLTRSGTPPALFLTEGLEDLLLIGDQTRPELFALDIIKPAPLWAETFGVRERLGADGSVLRALDEKRLRASARAARERGLQTAAVALLHSWKNPAHELRVAEILREEGFSHVSLSSALSAMQRLVPRAMAAVVDAYLTPTLSDFLERVAKKADPLWVMTSAGGLVPRSKFSARDSLLSGPAGGVVGALAAGRAAGFEKLIALDMGGTSTDVCRLEASGASLVFEHGVGGVRLLAPAVAVESVAAGGGSVCGLDDQGRLSVGPQSAGASPGPACYGRGGPLTLTDVNLLLGRLHPPTFSVPLDSRAAERALEELQERAKISDRDALLHGLIALADEAMADAIRTISVRQGEDPASYVLVAFGGAGGQHACGVAARLGIRAVLIPPDQSLLSAFGLARATLSHVAERQVLAPLDSVSPSALLAELEQEARIALSQSGADPARIFVERRISRLRLAGQETPLDLDAPPDSLKEAFLVRFEAIFGYLPPPSRVIEIESLRLIAKEQDEDDELTASGLKSVAATHKLEPTIEKLAGSTTKSAASINKSATPINKLKASLNKSTASLDELTTSVGPMVLPDAFSATYLPLNWRAERVKSGGLVLRTVPRSAMPRSSALLSPPCRVPSGCGEGGTDPIALELFSRRFTAIAEEMGETLRRTALSVNVRERLDFSCALLGPSGDLVASAAHIPVHLGALGVCVRRLLDEGFLKTPETIVVNHPAFGGSHLPDITLVTPVFAGELLGFVASRAHHAEIGGTRPGSMPPGARTLEEEGVVIPPVPFDRAALTRLLTESPYPTRALADNLADLDAQLAASLQGATLLRNLAKIHGTETLQALREALSERAERVVRAALISRVGTFCARERLDDGSPVVAAVTIDPSGGAHFDFTGTAPQHPSSFNAPPAVAYAAVLYVLRLLVGIDVPLSEGLLRAATLHLPEGSLVNPIFSPDPAQCPAVVAGNTEVSQRIVQALLKALNLSAGSQGTMNNVLFGDATFGYYETVCGGAGATPTAPGASGVHTHLTNTRLTDPEVLETRIPVRLEKFGLRRGSGGKGQHPGGDGVIREYRFLRALSLSLLTQSRAGNPPFGARGGHSGKPGRQRLLRRDGDIEDLLAIAATEVRAGDRLRLETPGGGGWGEPGTKPNRGSVR